MLNDTTISLQKKLIQPYHANSCLVHLKIFNALMPRIGRNDSRPMKKIERYVLLADVWKNRKIVWLNLNLSLFKAFKDLYFVSCE